MSDYIRWKKESVSFNAVEEAIDGLMKAFDPASADKSQQPIEESHFDSTILAYVRWQAHCKFDKKDPARKIGNSSVLAQEAMYYVEAKSKIPTLKKELKNNPGKESKEAFIKLFKAILHGTCAKDGKRGKPGKLKTIPMDWMRPKKNSSEKVEFSDELYADNNGGSENARDSTIRFEMEYAMDQIISEFDSLDQIMLRSFFFKGLKFSEISEKMGMDYEATRYRCNRGVERVVAELRQMGFEVKSLHE